MRTDRRTLEDVAELALLLARDMPASGPTATSPTADTTLEALGFDSLSFVEFGSLVEERWGLVIEPIVDVRTLGDLLALVDEADPVVPGTTLTPPGLGRYQAPAKAALRAPFNLVFSYDLVGLEHVPTSGPVLLCMNHDSAFDIVYTVQAIPRPVAVMSKGEVFKGAFLSRCIHELGGFQVDRDRFDRWAVQVALELLDRGHVLAMYPEGTRHAGSLLPFLPGAAYVALSRGLPMIPVALAGTDHVLPRDRNMPKRHPVSIVIGEPIPVERVDDPVERLRLAGPLTEQLQTRIARMLAEADPARAADPYAR